MKIEDIRNNTAPFAEDNNYVANLVSKVTEDTINLSHHKSILDMQFVRVAASVVLLAMFSWSGWLYMQKLDAEAAPLDTFLNSISDEETAMLDYFDVEDLYIDEI